MNLSEKLIEALQEQAKGKKIIVVGGHAVGKTVAMMNAIAALETTGHSVLVVDDTENNISDTYQREAEMPIIPLAEILPKMKLLHTPAKKSERTTPPQDFGKYSRYFRK